MDEQVKSQQVKLCQLGIPVVTDGIIGPKTRAAISEAVRVFGDDWVNADCEPYLVDSAAEINQAAVNKLLGITGGVKPVAWGRYAGHIKDSEIAVCNQNGIPILLIQSPSIRTSLRGTGATDAACLLTHLSQLKAKGANVIPQVFVDIELEEDRPSANLLEDYWVTWSGAISQGGFVPCVYMPNRNYWYKSWVQLESAISKGAVCGGTWVALYPQASDGSAVFHRYDMSQAPKNSDAIPMLAWQSCGNAYHMAYDFSKICVQGFPS